MKFLFREENVGPSNWTNRKNIVNRYFDIEKDPFVSKSDNYSVADFELMMDAIRRYEQ